jgi:hypothetical protein
MLTSMSLSILTTKNAGTGSTILERHPVKTAPAPNQVQIPIQRTAPPAAPVNPAPAKK